MSNQLDIENPIFKSVHKIMFLGQMLGFFPAPKSLRPFTWKSFKMLYVAFSIIGQTLVTISPNKSRGTNRLIQTEFFITHIFSLVQMIVFVDLAWRWPAFMKKWKKTELEMGSKFVNPRNLNGKVTGIVVFLVSLLIVEFTLSELSSSMTCCDHTRNSTEQKPFVYKLFNKFWNFQLMFGYAFMDTFVITISLCFASRLAQVEQRILHSVNKIGTNRQTWINLRKHYVRLAAFHQEINQVLSKVLIALFLPRLLRIVLIVFSSILPKCSPMENIYHLYALVFMLTKTLLLCIVTSSINETWSSLLKTLNMIPANQYNSEVALFIEHMNRYELCLNVANFFQIRRKVLLQIIGVTVTYELVLIQFNQELLQNGASANSCD